MASSDSGRGQAVCGSGKAEPQRRTNRGVVVTNRADITSGFIGSEYLGANKRIVAYHCSSDVKSRGLRQATGKTGSDVSGQRISASVAALSTQVWVEFEAAESERPMSCEVLCGWQSTEGKLSCEIMV